MSAFNLISQSNLFKINYYKKSENVYNSANVMQGRIKKRYDFTGKQRFVAVPISFSGGVGAGVLPTANPANYEGAVITAKKVYAVCAIDRETIKASQGNEGAFVEATKETVQKTVEAYMRNCSRILFGDGSGILGYGHAAGANVAGAGTSANPYIIEIVSTGFVDANWEENDLVQINVNGAVETTLLTISSVDLTNRKISLVGTSVRLAALTGAGPFSATDSVVMQGSYNLDPIGLKAVKDFSVAATGSLYNIPYQRRWSMFVKDANGAGLVTDLMNNVMLQVEKRSGKTPNMIVTSYEQYQKLLDQIEDHKRYNLPARAADLKGVLSFTGLEFMSINGPVGVFIDRFCRKDEMWFINDSYIEVHHRPGFGWFDDDGTVFLRAASSDQYEARYGGYYENFITPTFHGCLTNLAV